MKRYRADFFDRNFTFKDMAQTSNPTIVFDYLVLEKSSCTFPKKVDVNKGDYAIIRGDDILFYGIVVDFAYDGKRSTITFEQMRKLLDVDVFADASLLETQSIETWMMNCLRSVYQGSDTFQNLYGLTLSSSSTTSGTYQYSDDGIYNLYDLAVHFFKVYGVVCDVGLDIISKKVTFAFRSVSSRIFRVETSVADVIDYSINSSMGMENPNKITYQNEHDRTQEAVYYWHPTEFSGYVDTDSTTDRVLPVVSRCKVVTPVEEQRDQDDNITQEAKSFEQVAYEDAVSSMYQSKYDDQIEIRFNTDSKLLSIGEIGQLYRIVDGVNEYPTMLTGYQRVNDKHTLMTFGFVRSRFTQIFKIDRRDKI